MKEAIFYKLYKNFRGETPQAYVPVFDFMGEVYCTEVNKWGFVSFEVSARLSELFSENPGRLQRQTITGKSGARYYGYRIAPDVTPELIKDIKLFDFYKLIRQ